jgi:cytoskeletal protein CcmA (bactofilin family)
MFGDKKIKIKDSERSLISETVSIEGTINSSGAIDVAGLVKGPVYSKELIVRDTGSITGSIEADDVEIHGHLDGKVSAQNIVIGATGTVKGDIEFGSNLRTENGADTGDFLFKKKDKKETSETEERPEVVNKEALA